MRYLLLLLLAGCSTPLSEGWSVGYEHQEGPDAMRSTDGINVRKQLTPMPVSMPERTWVEPVGADLEPLWLRIEALEEEALVARAQRLSLSSSIFDLDAEPAIIPPASWVDDWTRVWSLLLPGLLALAGVVFGVKKVREASRE